MQAIPGHPILAVYIGETGPVLKDLGEKVRTRMHARMHVHKY